MRAQQKGCPGVGPRHGHWPQARLQGCCSSRAMTAALPVPLCMCKPLFSGLSLPQEESSLTSAMRAFEAGSCTAQGTQQAAVEGGDPLSDILLALRLPGSGLTVLTSCEHQRMASHLVPTETRGSTPAPPQWGDGSPKFADPEAARGRSGAEAAADLSPDAPPPPSRTSQGQALCPGRPSISGARLVLQLRSHKKPAVSLQPSQLHSLLHKPSSELKANENLSQGSHYPSARWAVRRRHEMAH